MTGRQFDYLLAPRHAGPTRAGDRGEVLAGHLTRIFGTLEDIRNISEFTEGVRGTIRISSTGGIISQYLSREIAEFARSFPIVDIDLREDASGAALYRHGESSWSAFGHERSFSRSPW